MFAEWKRCLRLNLTSCNPPLSLAFIVHHVVLWGSIRFLTRFYRSYLVQHGPLSVSLNAGHLQHYRRSYLRFFVHALVASNTEHKRDHFVTLIFTQFAVVLLTPQFAPLKSEASITLSCLCVGSVTLEIHFDPTHRECSCSF